ncbi:hypothetical protein [Foetidibacter luteolus]|uniref:hypothetical protein n=1 Tax=Foetidibacter luteolus TaxID=2608880 RepID=UPI00129AB97C|nr:hypothetical protein [Foetidibacter luteolus]
MTHFKINYKSFFLISLLFLFGCSDNKIETDKTLNKTDKQYIQSLKLLDTDEKIIRFYSEYKNKVAGNFFTDKRLAKYWIDERDRSKDKLDFAYYNDIKSIDTVYNADFTYCPYMLVTKNNGSKFKVCVDGSRKEIKDFFEDALNKWTQNKNAH